MTTKFFTRVAVVSWAFVAAGLAATFVFPASPDELGPAGAAFLIAFFSLPLALWSPVGLACAFVVKSGRGWTRLARAGVVLTYVAAAMTLVPALSTSNYYPGGHVGQLLLRLTVPVYVTTLAVAYASLVSAARVRPWFRRIGLVGVVAISAVPVVVCAMVIVDSGNRALFAGLGGLILFGLAGGVVLLVAHWRRRGSPDARADTTLMA